MGYPSYIYGNSEVLLSWDIIPSTYSWSSDIQKGMEMNYVFSQEMFQ
jgi:hypothetical protein